VESRMDGRVALVTGGSTGLGKGMALAFTGAGAKVAIWARRAEVLETAVAEIRATVPGADVRAYACDVTDAGGVEETFAAVESDLGPVDVLVNNAGKSETGAFESISDETWQADFDLKLFAAVRLARLAFPGMKARKWGRIINVLNYAAKAPPGGSAPTSVSRAAGMALTKVLSAEGAPHNVLVNCLLTGIIDSDQWARQHAAAAPNSDYRDFLETVAESQSIPQGRVGETAEFAQVACFLASDSGSYVTGTAINVDGGLSPVV